MAAVLRDSVLYDNVFVKKYIADARDRGGRVVPLPFEAIAVSVSTVADSYNLQVLPFGCKVVGLFCTTDGLGASAGAGRTCAIGDLADTDRLMLATDFDVSGAQGHLAVTGMGFKPTADTIVQALGAGGAWVVGKKIAGIISVVPVA